MNEIKLKMEEFMEDESGAGVVEVLLVLAAIVGIALIFKNQITSLVNSIWRSINSGAKKIYK